MSNGVHSYVTGAVFQGNNMVFSVQLGGFQVGDAVELSGSATQNNGALVSFYDIQPISAVDSKGIAQLTVQATPSAPFREGEDVTVFLRAAKVWVTVLGVEPGRLGGRQGGSAQEGTAWPKVKRETAIRAYAPAAPPDGQPPPGGQAVPAA
jgi:hypothetical protein